MSLKVGDTVEIVNSGSGYSNTWYDCSKYLKENNIPQHKVFDFYKIDNSVNLPTKATIVEVFENKVIEYLLKLNKYDLYTFMNEIDSGKTTCLVKSQPKENKTQTIKHIINDKATIIILEDDRKGIAKCLPDEQFNEFEGFCIAYYRALKGDKKAMPKLRLEDYSNEELLQEIQKRMNTK